MAKLNGVTIVSEKITYNGVEYVKTDAAANVGDIVRIGDEDCSYLTDGGYYEVTRLDSCDDAQIIDDDGDEYDTAALDEPLAVFAKVSVQSAPSTADTIVHNGVTYRKVARKAKEGDKYLVCTTSHYGFFTKGKVYEIYRLDSDGDPRITDDDGDDGVLCGADGENYVVLEPLAADAKLPSTLPSDYVIHEGAVYRKESRKAAKGEIVEVSGHPRACANGIFSVDRADTDGHIYYGIYGRLPGGYAVLVPADTVTIGGAVYALEKRKANVGESVVVVSHVGNDKYAYGEILTVKNHQERCDGKPAYSVGKMYIAMESDCLVLVPKASAKPTPIYTEVKRKANVGERIRIVAAEVTFGKYRNGDEFTAKHVSSTGGATFSTSDGDAYACQREYVVLEEAKPETVSTAKPAPANRLKVGDYAKVTEYGARGMESYRKTGDIVRITEVDRSSVPYNTEGLDGKYTGWASVESVVRATDAEVAAAKRKNVKVGDYVRITGNKAPNDGGPHHYNIGDIVEVTYVYSDSVSCVRKSDNRSQTVSAINYEPVTAAEAESARQKAEEDATKAAETAKWAKLGRKVGEFKAGDIVKIRDSWPAAGVADGEIAMIKTVDSDSSGVRLTKNNPQGYPAWVSSKYVTLVAPVESLFN